MGRHASGERRSRLAAAPDGEASGARADLQILLHTRRLQWLSALAIAVVFAVYFLVLVVVGHEDDWLLLLIIPAGLSGVIVGALLDHASRPRPEPPAEAASDSADGARAGGDSADGAASGDAGTKEPEVAEQADEPEFAGGLDDEGEPEA
jgi:hypothetical protein